MAAQDEPAAGDPRVYFAAERTLLAWVRTGLAMMGFGFVVARFGLLLREASLLRGPAAPPHEGVSRWVGIALVVLGVVVNVWAAIGHRRLLARLDRGEAIRSGWPSLGPSVALLLALLGVLLATYLVWGDAMA